MSSPLGVRERTQIPFFFTRKPLLSLNGLQQIPDTCTFLYSVLNLGIGGGIIGMFLVLVLAWRKEMGVHSR